MKASHGQYLSCKGYYVPLHVGGQPQRARVEQAAHLPLATPASSGSVVPHPVFPAVVRVSPQQSFAEAVRTRPVPLMSIWLPDSIVVPPLHVREQTAVTTVQTLPSFWGRSPCCPFLRGVVEPG